VKLALAARRVQVHGAAGWREHRLHGLAPSRRASGQAEHDVRGRMVGPYLTERRAATSRRGIERPFSPREIETTEAFALLCPVSP